MDPLELYKLIFFGFIIFMTVVLSGSYILYRVKKKSKNPPVYIQPKVIVSKHNKDKKEVITLPPPKPVPLKVKVDVQQPVQKKMQPVEVLQKPAGADQKTPLANTVQTSAAVKPSPPVPQPAVVNSQISQQEYSKEPTLPVEPARQYPQYHSSGEKRPEIPLSRPTIYRSTGESYPKVTLVSATRQSTVTSPKDRFQVVNKPKDLPKTSLSIAYYGVDRLSYQPPKYLRIDSQDQNK